MADAIVAAINAARRADRYLAEGRARDAAWSALYALEQDPRSALAWSFIGRLLIEVNQDPLGTLAVRHALELGAPDPERSRLERFHRIDLWTRGLIAARGFPSLLPASAFDDPAHFQTTRELDPWFDAQIAEWGSEASALRAAQRMVAALSDAWLVPDVEEKNPLRVDEGWAPRPEYEAWIDKEASSEAPPTLATEEADPATESRDHAVMVLSDHWIEQEILHHVLEGRLAQATDRARRWVELRPDRLRPKAALIRVLHADNEIEERDEVIAELLAAQSKDLNELEEVRIALGQLRLWNQQIELLDQMDALAPSHPVILANRGAARLELGAHLLGTLDLEAALAVDPDNGPALANLGLERMRQNEYVAARALLERAVAVAPDQPLARIYLGACKNNQNDRPGAIQELEEALRLDPTNARALSLLAELKAGVVPTN